MSALPFAFLLGFLGSLHCAVMCGPLMLSLPHAQRSGLWHFLSIVLYQLGRTLSYTVLGAAAGLMGSGVRAFTSQETFGLIFGGILVAGALLYLGGKRIPAFSSFHQRLISPLSVLMGKIYRFRLWSLWAGMLNGLIPCGMVYLALASSLSTGSIRGGMQFMFLFGCGTIPLMVAISIGGLYLKRYFRFNPNQLIPWFTLFLGALFMLRSANLDIPFLSPGHHHAYAHPVEICR
ncbi:Cytochrome C biogenesis protein transmembrane region [compost metagenome]